MSTLDFNLEELLSSDNPQLLKREIKRQLLFFIRQREDYERRLVIAKKEGGDLMATQIQALMIKENMLTDEEVRQGAAEQPEMLFQTINDHIKGLLTANKAKDEEIVRLNMEKESVQAKLTLQLHALEEQVANEKFKQHALVQQIDDIQETIKHEKENSMLSQSQRVKELSDELALTKSTVGSIKRERDDLISKLKEYDSIIVKTRLDCDNKIESMRQIHAQDGAINVDNNETYTHELEEKIKQFKIERDQEKAAWAADVDALVDIQASIESLQADNHTLNEKLVSSQKECNASVAEVDRKTSELREVYDKFNTLVNEYDAYKLAINISIDELKSGNFASLSELHDQINDMKNIAEKANALNEDNTLLINTFKENSRAIISFLYRDDPNHILETMCAKDEIDSVFTSIYTHINSQESIINELTNLKSHLNNEIQLKQIKQDEYEQTINNYYLCLRQITLLFPDQKGNPLLHSELLDKSVLAVNLFTRPIDQDILQYCKQSIDDHVDKAKEAAENVINLEYMIKELKLELHEYKMNYVMKHEVARNIDLIAKLQEEVKLTKLMLEKKEAIIDNLQSQVRDANEAKESCLADYTATIHDSKQQTIELQLTLDEYKKSNGDYMVQYNKLEKELDNAKREVKRLLLSSEPLSSDTPITHSSTSISSLNNNNGYKKRAMSLTPSHREPTSPINLTTGGITTSCMKQTQNNNNNKVPFNIQDEGQLVYLKNAVFAYIMGKEPKQMATVLSKILNFTNEEKTQVNEKMNSLFNFSLDRFQQ